MDSLQGHGCLNDIYSSVQETASLKGWDGVDLVIIGGDFQVCSPWLLVECGSHFLTFLSLPSGCPQFTRHGVHVCATEIQSDRRFP